MTETNDDMPFGPIPHEDDSFLYDIPNTVDEAIGLIGSKTQWREHIFMLRPYFVLHLEDTPEQIIDSLLNRRFQGCPYLITASSGRPFEGGFICANDWDRAFLAIESAISNYDFEIGEILYTRPMRTIELGALAADFEKIIRDLDKYDESEAQQVLMVISNGVPIGFLLSPFDFMMAMDSAEAEEMLYAFSYYTEEGTVERREFLHWSTPLEAPSEMAEVVSSYDDGQMTSAHKHVADDMREAEKLKALAESVDVLERCVNQGLPGACMLMANYLAFNPDLDPSGERYQTIALKAMKEREWYYRT